MVRVRWVAAAFAAVQVATYYLPFPAGVLPWSAALVAALALGNLGLWLAARRPLTGRSAARLGVASLALDTAVVLGLITTYTFDPNTASFALLYVLPLEGAVLFRLRGALVTMAAATVGYAAREVYGAVAYDVTFLPQSISFRTGLGLLIAAVAGWMASNLNAEREEAEAARAELERAAGELRTTNADLRAARHVQDDFLAMTNHELRTPLTAIVGYATMLQRRWDALADPARLDRSRGSRARGSASTRSSPTCSRSRPHRPAASASRSSRSRCNRCCARRSTGRGRTRSSTTASTRACSPTPGGSPRSWSTCCPTPASTGRRRCGWRCARTAAPS